MAGVKVVNFTPSTSGFPMSPLGLSPRQGRALPAAVPTCSFRAARLGARPMSRARLIILNAALGPLDYRVPHGMAVEPGSIVVAPLGPRQLVGVVWEPERLPTEEVGDNRLRPLLHAYDLPPLAAPLRRLIEWTADYYLAPLGAVLRMALPSSGALEGARVDHRISRHRPCPRAADAAARAGAGADRRAAGAGPRAGDHRRRLRRRDPRPRQGRRDRGDRGGDRRSLPDPRPGPRSARARARPGRGRRRAARRGRRRRIRALPARRRHRLGQDRSLFRGDRRGDPRRAGRRSSCSPKSRSPSPSSSASPPASAAIRCAWHSGLRQSQRRRAWRAIATGEARVVVGARSACSCPIAKLGLIVVDEAHEASFKQEDGVQYHARDVAVMRAKLEEIPVILASATPAIESRHMAEIGTYRELQAARPLRRRAPARHGGARPAPGPAAARPLARARAGPRARGESRRGRAEPALPQPPRLCAAHLVPPLRLPLPMPQLHRLDGRAPLHPPPRLPPLRPCHAGAARLPGMQGGGQPRRLRPRRRADRRRGRRAASPRRAPSSSPPTRSGPPPRRPSSSRGWRRARSTSSSAPSSSPRAIISPTSPWSAWSTPISASPAATCAPPSAASSRSARSPAAPAAATSPAASSSRPTIPPRR